jgi:hypothetical protein
MYKLLSKILAKSLLGKRLRVRILLKAWVKSFAVPFEADTKVLSANREAVRITSFALIWLQSVEWRSQALSNADKASLSLSSAVALTRSVR